MRHTRTGEHLRLYSAHIPPQQTERNTILCDLGATAATNETRADHNRSLPKRRVDYPTPTTAATSPIADMPFIGDYTVFLWNAQALFAAKAWKQTAK